MRRFSPGSIVAAEVTRRTASQWSRYPPPHVGGYPEVLRECIASVPAQSTATRGAGRGPGRGRRQCDRRVHQFQPVFFLLLVRVFILAELVAGLFRRRDDSPVDGRP